MKTLEYVAVIMGIVALIYIGVMLFLKSEEKSHKSNKEYKARVKQIKEVNHELDITIQTLDDLNQPMEKVSDFFKKVNNKLFKK